MEKITTYFQVDDQTIFRHCVRFMLDKEKDLAWAGDAKNGLEAVRKVNICRPDLVLMEFFLPGLNGSSVIREIKNHSAGTRVIVLSSSDADEDVLAAFKGGASAYCLKKAGLSELLRAIRQVEAGRTYLCPEIAGKVLTGYLENTKRLKSKASWETLTVREKEVTRMIVKGHTGPKIAGMLNITAGTVQKHRTSTMQKLGVGNTAELVAYALDRDAKGFGKNPEA